MVRRARRTRKQRRVAIPSPGGMTSVQFRRRRPQAPRCSICGSILKGVPHNMRKHSRSERRPSRPYGGTVCHACLMEALKKEARGQA